MSKRAEKAALKAYPVKMITLRNQDLIELFRKTEIESNEYPRSLFQEGYEQAEADTIERACEWLFAHLTILVDCYNEDIREKADRSEFIKLFRKQMEK